MNTGTFAGYLGRDADIKDLPSGQKVCNFSVAVSTGWGDKKSTLWVGCTLWGERGEKLAQYLTKGSAVTVTGDIDVRAWSAKDGAPKAEITCNVQRVTLQGGGEKTERAPVGTAATGKTPQQVKREEAPLVDDFDNDAPLPF